MNSPVARRARPYGGIGSAERKAERRARLIEAAVQIYGEVGFKNATVKAVCHAAGLTERYFYESFDNSEALLIAAYDDVNTRLMQTVQDSAKPSETQPVAAFNMLTAFFTTLKAEPRAAYLFLVEVRGISPQVDAAISCWLDRFGDLIVSVLDTPSTDRLLVRGTVGGLLHVAVAWIETGNAAPIGDVVRQAYALCRGLTAGMTGSH